MSSRLASTPTPGDGAIEAAEMVEAARRLASSLPALIRQAEVGGLQLVAQHLDKALRLAERVAASRPAR